MILFVHRSGGAVADLGLTTPPKNAKYAQMTERETLEGPGLLEPAYEACPALELGQRGLVVKQQKPLPVVYSGVKLGMPTAWTSSSRKLQRGPVDKLQPQC
ncbi:MAG: GxxExxY protein [Candidatus Bipolaricaulota bacterium]|nr:GxxExxY protein [Candidatus Bipolaricaulota bacterium]